MLIDVYKIDGSLADEKINLLDDIYSIEPNDHAIYLDVKAFLANQRQGTHKTKERGEVRGGGKKPWRQKGRGGARAGTIRSPLWIGGGTIFGPRPRDYRQKLPKKVKILARKSALSYKVKHKQLLVVEDFNFEQPKTKNFLNVINNLKINNKKVLFLTADYKLNVYKSGRNIPKVQILEAAKATTYDLLNNQILLMEKGAVKVIEKILSKNSKEVAENV
jgi:large subunit ribosomal protein L4